MPNFETNLRSRRVAVATIVAVVGILTTLATSITAVVKDAETIKYMHHFDDRSKNMFFQNQNFLTLQNDLVLNFQQITTIFQSHRRYVQDRISDFNDYIISDYIRNSETEILTLLSGGMPLTQDWIRDFNTCCLQVNSQQFCSKISLSDYVSFENSQLLMNSLTGNLELRTHLILPIESENFSSKPLRLYTTQNIGFYSGSDLVKIELPDHFILRILEDPLTGLFSREFLEIKNKCQRGVCPNQLVINHKSHCIDSIFSGHFDGCHYIKHEPQSPCELFSLQGQGVIVTAGSAIFKEKSDHFEQREVLISNSTSVIKKTGQLVCERNGLRTIHNLNTKMNYEHFSYNSYVQTFDLEANLTNLDQVQDRFQTIQNRVNDLEKFNANEYSQIGNSNVPHESLFNAMLIVLVTIILLVLAFFLFKKIEKKFLNSFD